jgi:hypothetical protein
MAQLMPTPRSGFLLLLLLPESICATRDMAAGDALCSLTSCLQDLFWGLQGRLGETQSDVHGAVSSNPWMSLACGKRIHFRESHRFKVSF